MIHFNALTVPTPQPYDKNDGNRQQENFFYVLNQILAQLKTNNETKELNPTLSQTVNVDLTDLTQAVQDLAFNGQEINLQDIVTGLNLILKFTGRTLNLQMQ